MNIILIIIFIFVLLVALASMIAGIRGAIWVPVFTRDLKTIIGHMHIQKGTVVYEFGSGDGRLLRMAARLGASATGYEINPFMAFIAKLLSLRSEVKIHVADAWTKSFSSADIVFVFLMPQHMKRLGEKMQTELKPGATLVTYIYPVPGMKHYRHAGNAYFYKISTTVDKQ